eukprot:15375563-Alexandrium_andersonii.AAC.1
MGGRAVPDAVKRPRLGDEGSPVSTGLRAPDTPPPSGTASVASADDGRFICEVLLSSAAAVGTSEPNEACLANSRKELRESEVSHLRGEIALSLIHI